MSLKVSLLEAITSSLLEGISEVIRSAGTLLVEATCMSLKVSLLEAITSSLLEGITRSS